MADTVVVAVTGGPGSSAALDWVIERARAAPIAIELVAVVESDWWPESAELRQYGTAYEKALAVSSDRLARALPDVHRSAVLRYGRPKVELVHASATAKLLVLGTTVSDSFVAAVYGTLPIRIAARAECPVVVVPAGWSPASGRIVVGIGEDDSDDAALEFAVAEAQRTGAPLDVVHAWTAPGTLGAEIVGSFDVSESLRVEHEGVLASVVGAMRKRHPGLEVRAVFRTGAAARALADVATGAALLVVGSHGRGGIAGLILGSVSHDVLMIMPCPVVVVPREKKPIDVLPEILEEDL